MGQLEKGNQAPAGVEADQGNLGKPAKLSNGLEGDGELGLERKLHGREAGQ